jgi:hypothetical protein
MSFEIPEFTDDLAHCDPCGWPEAATEYVPASLVPGDLSRTMNPFGGRWPVFAFLKRTCTRCGFQWAEAPMRPRPEPRIGPTLLLGQGDCHGPCCGGNGAVNYDH